MKKIILASFLALALIVFTSCGERYAEERGPVLDGTWTLRESYVGTDTLRWDYGKFITIREYEGQQLLLFYSKGRYDSSFFFNIRNENIYVQKVPDIVDTVYYRYTDRDSSGNDIILVEKQLNVVMKPLTPGTTNNPEKYYGTPEIKTDSTQLSLIIRRYLVDDSGAPRQTLHGVDVYIRPAEIEY
jgi:hypothetical protein